MAVSKKEFSAPDARPVVLYGLTDTVSPKAIPVLVDSSGRLKVSGPPWTKTTKPYASYQMLRIDFEGTQGQTTFTDISPNAKAISQFSGNSTDVICDRTKKAFGFSSGSFNNGGTNHGSLSIANSADFDLGSGDFTIDLRVYETGTSSGLSYQNGYILHASDPAGSDFGFYFYHTASISGNRYVFSYKQVGGGVVSLSWDALAGFNSWNRIRLIRTGSSIELFENYVSLGTNAISGAVTHPSCALLLGAVKFAFFGNHLIPGLNGFIDELSIYNTSIPYADTQTFILKLSEAPLVLQKYVDDTLIETDTAL